MQRKGRGKLEDMFDPEVIAILRKQFDEADVDRSGQIDAEEAVSLFARHCAAGSSDAEVKRTADALRNQIDSSRDGLISFEEYAFRFGRKLQMDIARARRGGSFQQPGQPPAAARPTPPAHTPPTAAPPPPKPAQPHSAGASASAAPSVGWSRETLTVVGIGAVLLAIAVAAILLPAPDQRGGAGGGGMGTGRGRRGASSKGR